MVKHALKDCLVAVFGKGLVGIAEVARVVVVEHGDTSHHLRTQLGRCLRPISGIGNAVLKNYVFQNYNELGNFDFVKKMKEPRTSSCADTEQRIRDKLADPSTRKRLVFSVVPTTLSTRGPAR